MKMSLFLKSKALAAAVALELVSRLSRFQVFAPQTHFRPVKLMSSIDRIDLTFFLTHVKNLLSCDGYQMIVRSKRVFTRAYSKEPYSIGEEVVCASIRF
jgi:hypothetical protein